MGLQDVDQDLSTKPIEVIEAHDHLGIPGEEPVQLRLVRHEVLEVRHFSEGPRRIAGRPGKWKALVEGRTDRLVPEIEHVLNGKGAPPEIGGLRRLDIQLLDIELLVGGRRGDFPRQGGTDRLETIVDDARAFVPGAETLDEKGNQDLVAFGDAPEKSAD